MKKSESYTSEVPLTHNRNITCNDFAFEGICCATYLYPRTLDQPAVEVSINTEQTICFPSIKPKQQSLQSGSIAFCVPVCLHASLM